MTQRAKGAEGERAMERRGRGKERRGKVSERLGGSKCKQVTLRDGKEGSRVRVSDAWQPHPSYVLVYRLPYVPVDDNQRVEGSFAHRAVLLSHKGCNLLDGLLRQQLTPPDRCSAPGLLASPDTLHRRRG